MPTMTHKGPGRPPQYVKFNGRIIVGLSGPKSPVDEDGRYYTTHNCPITGNRIYFGRDLKDAVRQFRAWKRSIKKSKKAMIENAVRI